MGATPRFIIETFGMIIIAGLSYILSQKGGGIASAIPVLGTLAVGAQRLLPTLQQGYLAISSIKGAQVPLQDVLSLLDQQRKDVSDNLPLTEAVPFQHKVSLSHVSFSYSLETPWVLKDINLTVFKGERIGFIGATGSGKSTLLDILMGLLQPDEGAFAVDGKTIVDSNLRAWQGRIAHVPQHIFLSDSTIEENIAFGHPKDQIDQKLVEKVAAEAQIADLIKGWDKQYQTVVGERGVRLSGGQRQRIGIARALYKQADVIVFDEATSALDNETESAVMEAIDGLDRDLTILIIAHRLSTLSGCTRIVELNKGNIVRIGSYNELIS